MRSMQNPESGVVYRIRVHSVHRTSRQEKVEYYGPYGTIGAARGQAKSHTTDPRHLAYTTWQSTATVEQMEGTWAPTA